MTISRAPEVKLWQKAQFWKAETLRNSSSKELAPEDASISSYERFQFTSRNNAFGETLKNDQVTLLHPSHFIKIQFYPSPTTILGEKLFVSARYQKLKFGSRLLKSPFWRSEDVREEGQAEAKLSCLSLNRKERLNFFNQLFARPRMRFHQFIIIRYYSF